VIFHTGWLSLIGKDDKRYSTGEPGVGVEGAKYLTGKGVVAVGADTWAVEAIRFESKNVFEVHQILLPMNGTYILENLDTSELAKDLRVPVRARSAPLPRRRAEHDQSGRDPLTKAGLGAHLSRRERSNCEAIRVRGWGPSIGCPPSPGATRRLLLAGER
jgi:hypothetical protein